MAENLFNNVYNPDVLNCLANLSNNEVFTPPEVVNWMLDMLPQKLFSDPNTTFLDPACKTGVFLREIAKRLIKGLEASFPDLDQRLEHIFHKQLFGIAITELTSLLSRRGVYCSKYPNSDFSVVHFDTPEGNIRFSRTEHTWKNGRCMFCGANREEYDRGDALETHAYEFIHTTTPEKIFNMKFDVIIGNPPYQLSDGGAQASAKPIYNLFVEQAMKLNPHYLTMIIPARWMTGGKGLTQFRGNIIRDKRFRILHDFVNSTDCFSGVDIKGGVCYFLWDRDYTGKCLILRHDNKIVIESCRNLAEAGDDIFIRYQELIAIKEKVWRQSQESFSSIVSAMKPYGLRGDVFDSYAKYNLPPLETQPVENGYRVLGLTGNRRSFRYVSKGYPLPKDDMLEAYKIFIPRNWGNGDLSDVPSALYLASPGELCTETFIQVGPFVSKIEMENAYSYIKTKFLRALVGIRKQDQGASKAVYQFVPMQDFSKSWTDEELYAKYNLTNEEVGFIESMIKPMEQNDK